MQQKALEIQRDLIVDVPLQNHMKNRRQPGEHGIVLKGSHNIVRKFLNVSFLFLLG